MPGRLRRVLILGGSGQLGAELCRAFAHIEVVAPSSRELPIERTDAMVVALDRIRPDLVVNATAFHQLDQCERDPERAFFVNALAVGSLARLCAEREIRFSTIGTDYVFSGDASRPYIESDRERPLNVYGISKRAGERLAEVANSQTVIFRLSGVFGRTGFSNKGPTFVERMIALAERHEPIRAVGNIRFSPSYAPDVAAVIRDVLEAETSGLFHLTNAGDCSWYELAVEAIRAAGLEWGVERSEYSNDDNAIKRPLYSVLGHAALLHRRYRPPRPWQAAVADYVSHRRAPAPTP